MWIGTIILNPKLERWIRQKADGEVREWACQRLARCRPPSIIFVVHLQSM